MTYSQPKVIQTVNYQSYNESPQLRHPAPKIVFASPSNSNLKKTSRIIQFGKVERNGTNHYNEIRPQTVNNIAPSSRYQANGHHFAQPLKQ